MSYKDILEVEDLAVRVEDTRQPSSPITYSLDGGGSWHPTPFQWADARRSMPHAWGMVADYLEYAPSWDSRYRSLPLPVELAVRWHAFPQEREVLETQVDDLDREDRVLFDYLRERGFCRSCDLHGIVTAALFRGDQGDPMCPECYSHYRA